MTLQFNMALDTTRNIQLWLKITAGIAVFMYLDFVQWPLFFFTM